MVGQGHGCDMKWLGRQGLRVCVIGLGLSVCGCAVGGKSMSIDSTSRSPWFNLELKERKKRADGPAHRAIRFDKSSHLRLETAGVSGAFGSDAPRKSLALPADQSLAADTSRDEPVELDFR